MGKLDNDPKPHNHSGMAFFLQILRRLRGNRQKAKLNSREELEAFKRDAIENRSKHY